MIRFSFFKLSLLLCLSASSQTPQSLTFSSPESGQVEHVASEHIQFTTGYKFTADQSDWMRAYLFNVDNTYTEQLIVGTLTNRVLDESLVVGTTTVQADVSPTGAASCNIPIMVPNGIGGMQPNLNVSYNGQSGQGLLGYGWNLAGLSMVSRTGKTIYSNGKTSPVTLTNEDVFILDGQRLVAVSGSNGGNNTIYKGETENYALIKSLGSIGNSPETFTLESKYGQKYTYGGGDEFLLKGQSIPGQVLQQAGFLNSVVGSNYQDIESLPKNVPMYWYLSKVEDLNGNYIEYHYKNQSGEILLDYVSYGGNLNNGYQHDKVVSFTYSDRVDQSSDFVSGNEIISKHILQNIKVTINGAQYKKYDFNYAIGGDSFTKLVSVQEEGSDGTKLNPILFKYGENPNSGGSIHGVTGIPEADTYGDIVVGDYNGDGFMDIFASYP